MTRGQLIALLNNGKILVSQEFNGDMYVESYKNDETGETTLSKGADALKKLEKVSNEEEFRKCVEEVNENYEYPGKLVFEAIKVPENYDKEDVNQSRSASLDYDYCIDEDGVINFDEDKKNNISFYSSDYHFIKNLSDDNIIIRFPEGDYMLKPGQIAADNFRHLFNNSAPKFVSAYDHKTYHYGATKEELRKCGIKLPRLLKA